ncbi:sensor domain-containing diguanylate cyclase [Aureimonas pseudogalii]|uniref:Diguanylate cyclase (GGDEF)-like protein n=1 Tax=Aureimonas pseudogalii TaxID=1744844 RepID=A0A7W6H7H1_9HYPH|nr:sensor domain-containing diguanylate cyclase [Aureimonas pseudogalii]MBB3999863.1 diguanylate cyclase (GGDEF)-like protein [Aureimonas pseudogalii]
MVDQHREAERIGVLLDLAILDTPAEREFNALASLAHRLFGTMASSFTLIDRDRQWFKAHVGMPASQTAREPALCNWVVENERALVLPDAACDPRFASSPLVCGGPKIRFYAGVPVSARSTAGVDVPVGTLCVIDDAPREIQGGELEALQELACIAEALLEARMTARRAIEVAQAKEQANQGLARERRLFKQAERIADMGSWRLTLADDSLEWSDGVHAIHDVPPGCGPSLADALAFYPEADRQRLAGTLAASIASGESFEAEADFVTARGRSKRVRCLGDVETVGGQAVAVVGVLQDITDRHRMEQELIRISRTDDLTGLANRAEFHRVLDARLSAADLSGEDLAVLLIDLDGFKAVNDNLGHAAGDEALRRIGERLRSWCRRDGFAARLGGDEFAVIVPDMKDPAAFPQRMDRLLADLCVWIGEPGRILPVSGTVGCAWASDAPRGRETLMKCADVALYAAKRSRKGTACTYEPPAVLAAAS